MCSRGFLVLSASVVSGVLLAGCSSSSAPSASTGSSSSSSGAATSSASSSPSSSATADGKALIDAAARRLAAAPAFRLTGTATESGQSAAFDMIETKTGAAGTLTVLGSKLRIFSNGKVIYFRAPDAFLRKHGGATDPKVLARLSGKWIRSSDTSQFGPFQNGPATVKGIVGPALDSTVPDWTRTKATTVGGVACDEVHSNAAGTTVDLRTSDHFPVAISGHDASSTANLHLSDAGALSLPPAPPASQVVSAD